MSAESFRKQIHEGAKQIANDNPDQLTYKEALALSARDTYNIKLSGLIGMGTPEQMLTIYDRWQAVVDSWTYINANKKVNR